MFDKRFNLFKLMGFQVRIDLSWIFIAILISWYVRAFPLKAQDRAIRAEESLRYYILTGKSLPATLRMGQIVALRFAPDEEFPGLIERSVRENLTGKEIKSAIKNWKPDYYRV